MTWAMLFESLGILWCRQCEEWFESHEHGDLEIRGDVEVFHWRDRRMTRAGIHKALRKIAVGRHKDLDKLPQWRGVFLLNQEVLALAGEAHVRLPRQGFDLDRARVRFALSIYTEADRRRMTPSEQTDFRAAIRWAARS